ncbi:MAG: DUF2946 domain-containing protein [Vitreoscilla sp.]|nr:DUF2946 domain-containing protein [Burkholderiales bacterium]MBP6338440.1 DUF2946 domain-containing protein [Vitreoscilla sp.]MBP6674573.1 DUF2946 domain-containing protein [Vitreoscilla sp.]
MSKLTRHINARWIATWLAVFGLAFAPTLSKAMVALGGGTDWVEVCSSQGNRLISAVDGAAAQQVDDSDAAGKALLHQLSSHCPLCGIASGGNLAPPPAPFALWLSLPEAPMVAFQDGQSLSELTLRTRPQPRAPPLFA